MTDDIMDEKLAEVLKDADRLLPLLRNPDVPEDSLRDTLHKLVELAYSAGKIVQGNELVANMREALHTVRRNMKLL